MDDEVDVRKSVRLILSKAGYDVVEAEDGEAGVRAIKRGDNSFALGAIICDLRMPYMSDINCSLNRLGLLGSSPSFVLGREIYEFDNQLLLYADKISVKIP